MRTIAYHEYVILREIPIELWTTELAGEVIDKLRAQGVPYSGSYFRLYSEMLVLYNQYRGANETTDPLDEILRYVDPDLWSKETALTWHHHFIDVRARYTIRFVEDLYEEVKRRFVEKERRRLNQ